MLGAQGLARIVRVLRPPAMTRLDRKNLAPHREQGTTASVAGYGPSALSSCAVKGATLAPDQADGWNLAVSATEEGVEDGFRPREALYQWRSKRENYAAPH